MFLKLQIGLMGLVYGKYSIQYIEFFRKRNLQPNIRPCLKDHFNTHFFPFYKRIAEAPLVKTRVTIQFNDSPFGCARKNCSLLKQKPDTFSAYRIGKNVLSAYGFLGWSYGTQHKEKAFFLNDRLVLGEISFSLHKTQKPDIEKIYSELARKYQVELPDTSKGFYLEDPADSLIFCHNNGFELILSYFNPNVNGILQAMEQWFQKPLKAEQGKETQIKL